MLVQQTEEIDMTSFMRSLMTSYIHYFNEKYGRIGSLFQDCYKAVRIESNEQLYQVIKYIELNPIKFVSDARSYPYSSLYSEMEKGWLSVPQSGYDPLPGRTSEQLSGVERAKAL